MLASLEGAVIDDACQVFFDKGIGVYLTLTDGRCFVFSGIFDVTEYKHGYRQ